MISRSLLYRLLSAALLIPIVLAILWANGPIFAALLVIGWMLSILEWRGLYKGTGVTSLIGFMGCGVALFTLMAASLWGLRHDFNNGFLVIVGVMGAIWISDSCAYLFGKVIGGKKMCPSISPNKTWAGMVGACAGPVILFLIILPHPVFALIGIAYGFAGQAGDLSISWLKRRAGVKDTGKLIPGHGGLLDRIDSLLLVAPLSYALIWLIVYA